MINNIIVFTGVNKVPRKRPSIPTSRVCSLCVDVFTVLCRKHAVHLELLKVICLLCYVERILTVFLVTDSQNLLQRRDVLLLLLLLFCFIVFR